MNLKLATLLIALSLPLAGCGNKGPLVLPPKPVPVEADTLPIEPPADDAIPPVDADNAVDPAVDPSTDAVAPPATDAASDDQTPPPPPATDGGND